MHSNQVGQLALCSIVLHDLHVMPLAGLIQEPNQHLSRRSRYTLPMVLQLESEASQIGASLLDHPAQSPEVVLAAVHELVGGRRHQALVGLHQVGLRQLNLLVRALSENAAS